MYDDYEVLKNVINMKIEYQKSNHRNKIFLSDWEIPDDIAKKAELYYKSQYSSVEFRKCKVRPTYDIIIEW